MPPTISNFEVSRVTNTIVKVSFYSDELLDTISVTLGGVSSPPPELTEADFSVSLGTYSGTIDLADGDYTALLEVASNAGGDGASGQSSSFVIPWPAQSLSTFSGFNDAPVPIILGNNPVEFTQFADIDLMTRRTLGSPQISGSALFSFGEVPVGQEIRYTTNGKLPTSKSKLYTGPMLITQNLSGSDNTIIKARYFDSNNPSLRSKIMSISFRV